MSNRIVEESSTKVTSKQRTARPSWAGKRVGRFRLISELGRGAMGRVIRAEDTLLHRQVALKVLPKVIRRGNKTVAVERLINEARAAATLDHPNVVTVYEVNESGGVYYIAMELLEGGSLRELVKAAGPMDSARACLMCADAAGALAQAHAMGIVHRDIKPANLMLTRSGRCKVVDFGLARVDDAGDLSVALPESVGTPQFIAPELLRGVPASAHSDIYSLGATLWYLLTGHAPFEATSAAELLRHHLESPLADLSALRPDLAPGLIQAVSKAMAKQPAERFDSVAQFEKVLRVYTIPAESSASMSLSAAASLNALMSVGEPVAAEQTVVVAPAVWRPSPWMLWAAGAAAVVFILLLVLLIKSLGSSDSGNAPPDRTRVAATGAQAPANRSSGFSTVQPGPTHAEPPAQPRATIAQSTPEPQTAQPTESIAPPVIPDDSAVLAARGKQLARHGQFVAAANEYSKAIKASPGDAWNWYYRASLAAYIGDTKNYRATCTGMFRKFVSSNSTVFRDKTGKVCALLEDSGVSPSDLLMLADTLPLDGGGSVDLKAWFHLCRGMALYRNARYQECIDMLQEAKDPDRMPRIATVEMFEAMSQWRLGRRAEAQSTLRDAVNRMEQQMPRPGIDDLGNNIEDWLICQVARKQAEKLVQR